jgi:hypothetical protein
MQKALNCKDLYEYVPDLIRKETLRPKTPSFHIKWNDVFWLKRGRTKDEDTKEMASLYSWHLQIFGQKRGKNDQLSCTIKA